MACALNVVDTMNFVMALVVYYTMNVKNMQGRDKNKDSRKGCHA